MLVRGLISLNSESKETIRTDYPQLKIDINKVLQCPYAQQTYHLSRILTV